MKEKVKHLDNPETERTRKTLTDVSTEGSVNDAAKMTSITY
jgi:molybdenum-dependent DNA-binding transcriptional regulator ModE